MTKEKIKGVFYGLAARWERYSKGKAGYTLMEMAQRWAKNHPDRIFVSRIDDSVFSSSTLMLLVCEGTPKDKPKEKEFFFGVDVHVIPQNSGEPSHFFMYPQHIEELLENLKEIRKKMMEYPETRKEILEWRKWRQEEKDAQ